ncbi:MAG: endolytic transglycosylase MltG, partial [Chromatocurvus sp.]
NQWRQPLDMPREGYYLEVAPGDSLALLSNRLAADGVIRSAWMLNLYGRLTGLDARLHSGEYRFEGRLTAAQMLARIGRGDVVTYSVTLPEGITLARALAILSATPGLVAALTGVDDERLLALAGGRLSAEGLFLPETYRYERGSSDWDILRRANADLMSALGRLWDQRPVSLPYSEPYEALIMASIVERETGVARERGQVAGVFVRRLQRGMRLQTDPTVIYGLGADFDGDLTRAHLRDADNPYNTYRHDGLPPTPIALPGVPALRAALNPEAGSALYFVARGDGSHVFSDTLEEHQQAVQRYQLRRRSDYRSHPARE